MGGLLLLCVGMLGEYLGRVYDEVRSRPLSIINQVYYAPDTVLPLSTTSWPAEDRDRSM